MEYKIKFGTSGIRDLTANLLRHGVAAKLAAVLSKKHKTVSIGRDGRTGSRELAEEFICAFDGVVRDCGITVTPAMAGRGGLAVMVTASHNPACYCGFKVYINGKEPDNLAELETELNELQVKNYYDKVNDLPDDVVIDCANGGLGHRLKLCGFKNIINYEGDINTGCGATHPENLQNYCKEHGHEIGFTVDGDADRILMFLDGRVLDGDEMGFLIAKLLGAEAIVIDETVNSELKNHFDCRVSKVGSSAVVGAMTGKYTFGAEKSGHYYFEQGMFSSDSLDAINLIYKKYKEIGAKGLCGILAAYRPLFQLNEKVELKKLKSDWEKIVGETNLKEFRSVIRKSGTEPILRLMLEGKNERSVRSAMKSLLQKITV